MTGKGHTLTGLAFSIHPAIIGFILCNPIVAILTIPITMMGATAPDWLEIPYKSKNASGRVVVKRIIPHRTITHTISFWVLGVVVAYWGMTDSWPSQITIDGSKEFWVAMYAFFSGGCIHLLGDIPNERKIPILSKKTSFCLNWWSSGKFEAPIVVMVFVLSLPLSYLVLK